VVVLLVVALVGGVVIGLARGGTIEALSRVRVHRPWLLAGVVIVLVLARVEPRLNGPGWVAATVLMAGFAATNNRLPGLSLVLAGLALNTIVIVANGGQLPVSLWGAERAGIRAEKVLSSPVYEPGDSRTVLRPATDVIPLALPGVPSVVGLGDVLMASGVGLFGAVAPVRARRTLAARRHGRRTQPPRTTSTP
jgi:Family of unknown function (DUF5317)